MVAKKESKIYCPNTIIIIYLRVDIVFYIFYTISTPNLIPTLALDLTLLPMLN